MLANVKLVAGADRVDKGRDFPKVTRVVIERQSQGWSIGVQNVSCTGQRFDFRTFDVQFEEVDALVLENAVEGSAGDMDGATFG